MPYYSRHESSSSPMVFIDGVAAAGGTKHARPQMLTANLSNGSINNRPCTSTTRPSQSSRYISNRPYTSTIRKSLSYPAYQPMNSVSVTPTGRRARKSSEPMNSVSVTPTRRRSSKSSDYNSLENEIRIVLIGRTGSGKSATGNTILGFDKFRSHPSGSSLTKKCQKGETNLNRNRVLVVDTPGMFDTDMTNKRVLQEIVKCVGMTSPGPHAFILVVSVGRFTQEEENTVKLFITHFSKEILNYMIVLFTRRDEIEKSSISISNYIRQVPKSLKSILNQCGNRYIAFDNRAASHDKIVQVQELIHLIKQTVRRNGRSYYSNAMYQNAEAEIRQLMEIERNKIKMKLEREKAEFIKQVSKPLYSTIQQNQEHIKRLQMQQTEMTARQNRVRQTQEQIKRLQIEHTEMKAQQNSDRQQQISNHNNEPSDMELRSTIRTHIQNEEKSVIARLCNGFKNACFSAASGASVGASVGSMIAGPIGAPIGAVLGAVFGFFKGIFD